ncbi:hypothetical protein P3L10_009801 [Capsicum annuum]
MVTWEKPMLGFLNLDINSCSKGNPGSFGGRGLLRDHIGSYIFAFADLYDQISNNVVEIKAILQGMKMCLEDNYLNIVVESDSQEEDTIVDHLDNIGENIKKLSIYHEMNSLP